MSDRPRKKSRVTHCQSSAPNTLDAGTFSLSANTNPVEQTQEIIAFPLGAQQMARPSPSSSTPATEDADDRGEKHGLFRLGPCLTTNNNHEDAGACAFDIVAVHGIMGDPYNSWTHANGNIWLQDQIPIDFPGVRVFSYGYPASVFRTLGTGSIEEFSRVLLEGLRRERREKEYQKRPIVFVCHSMGGIVVKKALVIAKIEDRRFENILMSVKGIIFLATPHRGSTETQYPAILADIANVALSKTGAARLFGRSRSDLIKVLEKDSQILLDISTDFRNQLRRIQIASLIEQDITPPARSLVVDKRSAIMGVPDEIIHPMPACDHNSICKFAGPRSEGYKTVLNVLKDWMDEIHKLDNEAKPDMDLECLQSLAFPEITNRRQEADQALPQTCDWILRHKHYIAWIEREREILWIKGKPGSGKSTLLAFIYKSFNKYSWSSETLLLDFFFHARGSSLQKTSIGMFRSLLAQLYDKVAAVRSQISTAFIEKRKLGVAGSGWQWQVKELQDIFSAAILEASKSRPVIIFLDALDEVGSETGSNLLIYFEDLYTNSLAPRNATVRLCVSSRYYPTFSINTNMRVSVDEENHQDIQKYVTDRFERLSEQDTVSLSDKEKKLLAETIVTRAKGVFMWAGAIIPEITVYIREGCPYSYINQKLMELPELLSQVYENIFKTVIRPEYRPKTYLLMQWVCFAKEPLSVTELRYAFSSDDLLQSEKFEQNYTDLNMKAQIISWSGGLVEFKHHQNKTVVQAIHHSVLDYIESDGLKYLDSATNAFLTQYERESTVVSKKLILGKSQQRLCKSCINYLQRGEVLEASQAALPTNLYEREEVFLKALPFIRYATSFWFLHAQQSERLGIPQDDLIQLLGSPPGSTLMTWIKIFGAIDKYNAACPAPGSTLLHIACISDLRSVVKILLSDTESANTPDDAGNTPLHFAAQWGHLELVQILLDAGARIHGRYHEGLTPLVRAARSGHKDALLPLKQQMEGNIRPSHEAIHAAAENGHNAVVEKLLEKGADINAGEGDEYGPALLAASAMGHEGVVRLLLDNGADIEARNIDGETALLWAAGHGHKLIVQLLVERKANIEGRDKGDVTPLIWAARSGSEDIVRLLLMEGADKEARDNEGATALLYAAECGFENIMLLLINEGADVKVTDSCGMTSLMWVAQHGCLAVMQLLLEKRANIEAKENGRMTALLFAAQQGFRAGVRLLLDKEANIKARDCEGMSVLHLAARHGSESVVQLLLSKGADTEARDTEGWTPLFWAATQGFEAVVRLLLENNANPKSTDKTGKRAVFYAARFGYEAIVRMLTPQSSNL